MGYRKRRGARRSRSDGDSDFFGRLHRWRTPRGLHAFLFQESLAVEIVGILHGPTDSQRFHAPECGGGTVLQVRERPAQSSDGYLGVHALEDVQDLIGGHVVIRVHGDRHSALRRPFDNLKIFFGILRTRMRIVVHRPGDTFAESIEPQHIVTEAHRKKLQQALVFVEFLAGRHAAQAVGHPQREMAFAPDLEDGFVTLRLKIVAAGVDHAGQPQAIQLAEELARAFHLLSQNWVAEDGRRVK